MLPAAETAPVTIPPVHRQSDARIRFDWGPVGAEAIVDGADVAVVVDVLSFTTAVTVAVDKGMRVLPYRWRDASAASYAEARGAALAVGRSVGDRTGEVSLSPRSIARADNIDRLVLPSPNGSTIAFTLAERGAVVVAASLRNAGAVAAWLAPRLTTGAAVAVVAGGERWPDDSLRPAVEDLWGAGAVISGLLRSGVAGPSPEALMAARAYDAIATDIPTQLVSTASGRELVTAGFAGDVAMAAELDVSAVVPVLGDDGFGPAPG